MILCQEIGFKNRDTFLCSTLTWYKKMHFCVMEFYRAQCEHMAASYAWLDHYNGHTHTWNDTGTWVQKCYDKKSNVSSLVPQSWFTILKCLLDGWETSQTFLTHHWANKFQKKTGQHIYDVTRMWNTVLCKAKCTHMHAYPMRRSHLEWKTFFKRLH